MITFNEDEVLCEEIRKQLVENGGYCPCQLQQNKDTKCMCKLFRDQVKKKIEGECHCGLYIYKNS